MDFSEDRTMSKNTLIGIGIVILLHILLVYALISGLAANVVGVINRPLEIKIIQQAPLAPPKPAQITPPPPPVLATPPPPYIPPPLIQVQTPPPLQPVIAVTTQAPPPAPRTTAPAPPAPPAPPPSTSVAVVCPNVDAVAEKLSDMFQSIADNDGISDARVVLQFTVGANGAVSDTSVVSSDASDVNSLALRGVAMLRCVGQGQAVQVSLPFEFRSD